MDMNEGPPPPNDDENDAPSDGEAANPCGICLGELPTDAVRPECGHAFHADCLRQWMTTSGQTGARKCPTCRMRIELSTIEEVMTTSDAAESVRLRCLNALLFCLNVRRYWDSSGCMVRHSDHGQAQCSSARATHRPN